MLSTRQLTRTFLKNSLLPSTSSSIPVTTLNLTPSRFTKSSSTFKQFSTSQLRTSEAETKKETETKGEGEKVENSKSDELIKEKDAKIKELQDQVLYGKADLQNLQRRSSEEKAAAGDFAITKLSKDLVSSLDILSIALRSVPESLRKPPSDISTLPTEDPKRVLSELYSGVELTNKSILDMLKTHGITQFDPTGEKFDPREHEAMYQAPVPGKEPGSVLECSQVGFKIKGRILRAAQVGVVQESG